MFRHAYTEVQTIRNFHTRAPVSINMQILCIIRTSKGHQFSFNRYGYVKHTVICVGNIYTMFFNVMAVRHQLQRTYRGSSYPSSPLLQLAEWIILCFCIRG